MPDRPPLDVALVIPVYNERDNLPLLIDEITHAVGGTGRRYEIVAVDDASTDGSLDVLRGLERDHPELRVVALAEHAGQTAALAAGFRAACSRVVVTLDADLQNDPADVPALLAELERSSAAAVVGYRVNRHDSGWKRLQSRIANGVRNRLNRETIRDTGCSLKAFRADAVRALPLFDGMHRFLPTLVRMGGGTVVEVPVRHRPRRFGRTKYGMWNRVFRSFADALAVRWMQRRALRYRIREELR
ncbi:MAG: glycosyltransferase [Gemmatimonadetes bacterium 13_2_20CM_69_27]|nr:MAG: glycosyltransferase [Gemmatimonadetes bacterium 13_2_20CM_69_27]OLB52107.1 MAG: glycosyltransferase [Gemmatimonadetes bacterium 13_2_20CM_2_69_23]OLD59267.1 MAG: glycosyltransferase [Gemmatimonadetes bacterium 13_1_20CM_69_28]PYO30815.1 MAG: glycosyltransferase [Gemmatimonadota bacterium]PYP26455.1 MAG: glycosyltransferase [Gemmatimonadota bacterium]